MIYCTNCGKEIKEGSGFCTACGTKVDYEKIREEMGESTEQVQDDLLEGVPQSLWGFCRTFDRIENYILENHNLIAVALLGGFGASVLLGALTKNASIKLFTLMIGITFLAVFVGLFVVAVALGHSLALRTSIGKSWINSGFVAGKVFFFVFKFVVKVMFGWWAGEICGRIFAVLDNFTYLLAAVSTSLCFGLCRGLWLLIKWIGRGLFLVIKKLADKIKEKK